MRLGLSLKRKMTPDRKSRLHKTPRDDAELIRGGKADAQGTGDKKHDIKNRAGRGLGLRSRLAGGGSGCEVEGGRQREEGNPGRENPGSDRDLGAGQGRQRGATGRGKAGTGSHEELLWANWQGR